MWEAYEEGRTGFHVPCLLPRELVCDVEHPGTVPMLCPTTQSQHAGLVITGCQPFLRVLSLKLPLSLGELKGRSVRVCVCVCVFTRTQVVKRFHEEFCWI